LVWGLAIGWLMLHLRRWVADTRVEITLSILTPYLAFWPPKYLGGSGVLATVTAGLYISWNGLRLISAATRLQGIFFWDLLIYLTEGLVFLITGLQARTMIARLGPFSVGELIVSALVVCLVVIAARFVWTFPATYLPRRLSPSLARRDPAPPWQYPFALAFTGVRGIVSLAAALAIPLTTERGEPFPHRDLILFLTFAVILVTLVGQGLLLPAVIRWLGLANTGLRERLDTRAEEFAARRQAVRAVIERLEALGLEEEYSKEVLDPLRTRHGERLRHVAHHSDGDEDHRKLSEVHDRIELALIEAERQAINELYRKGRVKDEARRRIERDLDLREALNTRDETE
jgi:CPA1 family monovalent cation:H+ antiporter